MNRFASFFIAFGLASAGSTAFAEQAKDQLSTQAAKPQPVMMTDAQMDNVAAGLVNVMLIDLIDIERNNVAVQVAVPVNATVAAQILSSGVNEAVGVQRPGAQLTRLTQ